MKHALIISFDLIRFGELKQSLSIASLLSYAKTDQQYGGEFLLHNLTFNAFEIPKSFDNTYFENHLKIYNLESIDTIAISAYVWSEYLINPLIKFLRLNGFKNKIALGGYQITYGNREQLVNEYPDCDIFISGYGELSVLEAIKMKKVAGKLFLNQAVDFSQLPSPYLTNEIRIPLNQSMVRIESKRGCPYRCTFCAHRDLTQNKVHKHEIEKVYEELELFKEKNVSRVNFLDPVFNVGNHYIDILNEIYRLQFQNTTFTLQTRFELIRNEEGANFLTLVEKTKAHLEFGIQTIIPAEYKLVNRPNKPEHISKLFKQLNDRNISYEVSLIYGLPNQTVDSFKRSIDFVRSNGCSNITAYPLMLLKGTELYHDKEKWGMTEEQIGEFNIPVVVSSISFNKDDWYQMRIIANKLNPNQRV